MSRGPGRPVVYKGNVARHIAGLVSKHNASHARAILNASPRSPLRSSRNVKLVPKALGISLPTVIKIAKAAGVELHRGRPAKAA